MEACVSPDNERSYQYVKELFCRLDKPELCDGKLVARIKISELIGIGVCPEGKFALHEESEML